MALKPLMPLIDYALNYEKITTELCINIEKPELLCNGFCYLREEVNTTEKNHSKNNDVNYLIKYSEAIVSQKQEIEDVNSFKKFLKLPKDLYLNNYKNQLIKLIFHPPIT